MNRRIHNPYRKLTQMRKYISLSICLVACLAFVNSPVQGQSEDDKFNAAVTALLAVHSGESVKSLLVVPSSPVDGGLANRLATRIGAKSSGLISASPGVRTVRVEVVSIDERSAAVRVVTHGVNELHHQSTHGKKWVSVADVWMVRSGKKWVITGQLLGMS